MFWAKLLRPTWGPKGARPEFAGFGRVPHCMGPIWRFRALKLYSSGLPTLWGQEGAGTRDLEVLSSDLRGSPPYGGGPEVWAHLVLSRPGLRSSFHQYCHLRASKICTVAGRNVRRTPMK